MNFTYSNLLDWENMFIAKTQKYDTINYYWYTVHYILLSLKSNINSVYILRWWFSLRVHNSYGVSACLWLATRPRLMGIASHMQIPCVPPGGGVSIRGVRLTPAMLWCALSIRWLIYDRYVQLISTRRSQLKGSLKIKKLLRCSVQNEIDSISYIFTTSVAQSRS